MIKTKQRLFLVPSLFPNLSATDVASIESESKETVLPTSCASRAKISFLPHPCGAPVPKYSLQITYCAANVLEK